VLQVHHRKQLASNDSPRLTKLRDLAVLCANCHMLVHMDPYKAIAVEKLRKMLARTRVI
jgi:predicted HNH restriction endonuclease